MKQAEITPFLACRTILQAPEKPSTVSTSGEPTFGREDGGMQSMGIATQQNAAPLDAVEAAKIVGMNSRTLVLWARRGYVPAHPLGEGKRRIWRFFESELLD